MKFSIKFFQNCSLAVVSLSTFATLSCSRTVVMDLIDLLMMSEQLGLFQFTKYLQYYSATLKQEQHLNSICIQKSSKRRCSVVCTISALSLIIFAFLSGVMLSSFISILVRREKSLIVLHTKQLYLYLNQMISVTQKFSQVWHQTQSE